MTNRRIHQSQSLIDFLTLNNRLDTKCQCCGKPLFSNQDIEVFKSYKVVPSNRRGLVLKVLTLDGKFKYCQEPNEHKWTLIGICSQGKTYYRDVCWSCFRSNLRNRANDGKHIIPSNTKPNSWWMRIINGEDAYPMGKASAIGRYWADLMFTSLSKEELGSLSSKFDTASIDSFIRRFGEVDGRRMYEDYIEFQSIKNSFEYKHKQYGWNKDEFEQFNKSRSVTLKLCIKKHGEELGKKIFDEYCKKQAYSGCKLEYFIEKYGEDDGTKKYRELNKMKVLNEDTFVRKYGEEEGRKRYVEFQLNHKSWSNISQELFNKIIGHISSVMLNKVRYATLGGEDCIQGSIGFMFPDFIYDNRKIIEFNGDYWHRNPRLYSESDDCVKQIWEHDKNRLNELKSLGYDVLVIWEMDYRNNPEQIVDKCIGFLLN